MYPSRFAIICAGQGQQATLDFYPLRPSADDGDEYQLVWSCFSREMGGELDEVWASLSQEQRTQNLNAQLGVVAWQVLRYLRSRAILPRVDWVLGYSVGELSAQAIAGAIPLNEIAGLVKSRACLMDETISNPKHQPCLVLLSEHLPPQVRQRRKECLNQLGLECAIQRSQAESIWGGTPEAVALFLEESKKGSWNARPIDVRVPSHTPYLSSAVPLFREALKASSLKSPQIKILAGISAEPVQTVSEVLDALSLQLAQTIRWEDCLLAIRERGITQVWDIGPGEDQSRLIQELNSSIRIFDQPGLSN